MSNPKHIGVVGLGAMGRPMARHMMAAGYSVSGCDPNRDAQQKAATLGVTVMANAADTARASDFVQVVVGFDADVERVFFGGGGLMEAARPGLIVGIGSTISPTFARELAERTKDSGIVLIDMPLTRGQAAADAGQMLVLGGGPKDVFETCRPVFETYASDVFWLGEFGAGQVAKMTNNMILWACIAANDEAFRLAGGLGVDLDLLRTALCHSSAQNWAMSRNIQNDPMPWAEKDMVIAMAEADEVRMPLPLSMHVRELIKDLKIRHGYPTPKSPK
ncbi:MAG: NAD(P)-dependent oxidoreductase [Beijerinckiaceae bacterium]